MNWYKKALTVYRGDSNPIELSEFNPEYGTKISLKDLGSSMTEGPGIYFTTNKKNAENYGDNITQREISPNAKILSKESPKFTPEQIIKILNTIDPSKIELAASNWDENVNKGKRMLWNSIIEQDNAIDQLMEIWAEVYAHQHPSEFMKIMTLNGIDGIVVDKSCSLYGEVKHYIIYNQQILL